MEHSKTVDWGDVAKAACNFEMALAMSQCLDHRSSWLLTLGRCCHITRVGHVLFSLVFLLVSGLNELHTAHREHRFHSRCSIVFLVFSVAFQSQVFRGWSLLSRIKGLGPFDWTVWLGRVWRVRSLFPVLSIVLLALVWRLCPSSVQVPL